MVCVGSFESLQSVRGRPRFSDGCLEVHTWVRTEISLISPLVEWLVSLIAQSRCVDGREDLVELALHEALSNAMLHGNRLHARKLVHLRCCWEVDKGVRIIVRDQGQGFDPEQLPDPLASENLAAERGRGILLMKLAMHEIWFAGKGTEVHLRKAPERKQEAASRRPGRGVRHWLVRPSLRGSCCRVSPAPTLMAQSNLLNKIAYRAM